MATAKVRGITIELGADTSAIVQAFKNTTASVKDTEKYLKDVSSLLKFNPQDLNLLNERQIALNQAISETSNRLKLLKAMYEELPQGENGQLTEEQKKLQQEISITEGTLAKYQTQLESNSNTIYKVTGATEELGNETVESANKAEEHSRGWYVLNGVLTNLANEAISSVRKGLQSLGDVLVNTGKQALDSYADYEQLVGGIESLFGEDIASAVEANANQAFKTAGMSANEYMETVTQFSASLIKSLDGDTEKAVSVADMAIQDMGDNANRFGTNIESIQNAYRGFARGNFTMLDNLSLGFAGTKQGMQDLLAYATELSGVEYDIESYADMVEAIHVVQQSYGVTGTTADEARRTIQGSTKAMKARWQNMLTGIADDEQDFNVLVENLVGTLVDVFANILPRVEAIIEGLATFLTEALTTMIPQLVDILIPVIQTTIPKLTSTLLVTILDALPMILDTGVELILAMIDGIIEATPTLVEQIPIIITKLADTIVKNLPLIVQKGLELIVALGKGIVQQFPQIMALIPTLFGGMLKAIGGSLAGIFDIGSNLVKGLWNGISNVKEWILSKIRGFGSSILSGMKSFFGIHSPSTVFRDQVGAMLAEGIGVGFTDEMDDVVKDMNKAVPTSFDMNTNGNVLTQSPNALGGYAINITINESTNAQATANEVMNRLQLAVGNLERTWR